VITQIPRTLRGGLQVTVNHQPGKSAAPGTATP
jgi:hypothetical protein